MTGTLRARQQELAEQWHQGLDGRELLRRHAALVDAFIVEQFDRARDAGEIPGQVAMVALGGYGRSELYPYSDIDLLLLHDQRAGSALQAAARALLYPLWDAGCEVGHSVRTVAEAVRFAREDFPFQVALLDARLVVGAAPLLEELRQRYTTTILQGRRQQFVRAMQDWRAQRRNRYGSHSFLLEPHIKEGTGGLRDIQAMRWVARGVFSLPDLEAVQGSGLLADADRQAFEQARAMLTRIRYGLHRLCGRKSDHLVLDYQEDLAAALGYRDQDGQRGVERFMREVYTHLQTVAVVTDLFFEHVLEILGMTGPAAGERRLERAIAVRGGTVRLTAPEELGQRSYLLMRLFLQAGRTGLPLHHRTRQAVTAHLHLVDDGFRESRRVARIFSELLTTSREIFPVLEAMLATGLLTRYLPEFAAVESLAQHDLYHLYTVDRHQLQTVAELAALRQEMAELFAEAGETEVLYLAALLHDIGKGRQADHSQLGAELAAAIGRRLQLSAADCDLLAFLVRHHLYLPENGLRRDCTDREFIRQAAAVVGDVRRLTLLYLLTIADSRATGPSAWSNWKAGLVAELYLGVKTYLAAGGAATGDDHGESEGVRWLREQVATLLAGGQTAIDPAVLPADYLLGFSPEEVGRHLGIHQEQAGRLRQQVLLFAEPGEHGWHLLIMGDDRPGLLAKFCGVLALHGLRVRSARIFTWPDGTVVDSLEVVPAALREFDEMDWGRVERDLNLAINYRLDVGFRLLEQRQPRPWGPARPVQQAQRRVMLDNQTSGRFTIVEVHAGDSPEILYQLAQTLADFDLTIHQARIATEVEQLIDVFYVRTATGGQLTDPEAMAALQSALLRLIGEEAEVAA